MRKGLILPLLIPLLAYGAVKGYLWYQVKRFADQLAVQVADVATFEYGSIETSFDGVAGIRNVRIYPMGSDYPLKVDAIRAVSDSWLYFMKLGTPLDKGDLPNQLGFQVLGMDFDFNAPYFSQLEAYAAAVNDPYTGCGQSQVGGLELMKKLGYSSLYTDIKIAYQFNPESEYMTLTMDSSSAGSFEMGMSADVDMGVTKLTRNSAFSVQPKLGGVSLYYKDQAFNRKYLQYCAALNSETVDQFVDRHVGLLAEQYQTVGLSFNKELVEAYRQFISTDGEMKLKLTTENPLGMAEMAVGAEEHLKAWDVQLEVNGQPVSPVEIDWNMPETDAAVAQTEPPARVVSGTATEASAEQVESTEAMLTDSSAQTSEQSESERSYEQPAYEPEEKKYVDKSVTDLSRYIGSAIRLETHNGHLIEGTIVKIRRNQVQVEQKMDGGVALLPILFSNIKKAEVLL
ncbi:MAG: hypothetical protein OQK12_08650 [Motiliproteus sp.]|nr:hypothetical protein [Motiliproteus sp.]MCW9052050.1 hypothetical protein [Motiliproteus sp.]